MKTLRAIFLVLMTLSFANKQAEAAILPARVIFEKVVENNGATPLQIETEVSLNSENTILLKELWKIDNSRNMQLTVINPATQTVVFTAAIKEGVRTSSASAKGDVGFDFIERYHHFRSLNEMAKLFVSMGVVPNQFLNHSPFGSLRDSFTYKEEPFVRLARAGGVINYHFGNIESSSSPASLWIEQDAFHIRKIRLQSGAEIEFSDYSEIGKGQFYPKQKVVRWDGKEVKIRFKSVNPKLATANARPTADSAGWATLSDSNARSLAEEFYSRFR
ncbi:MAG: hypothetical protein ACLGGX_11725 [Bdellovibrionia bacterium]